MIHEKRNLGDVLKYVNNVVPRVDPNGLKTEMECVELKVVKTEDLSLVFETFGWLYLTGGVLGRIRILSFSFLLFFLMLGERKT